MEVAGEALGHLSMGLGWLCADLEIICRSDGCGVHDMPLLLLVLVLVFFFIWLRVLQRKLTFYHSWGSPFVQGCSVHAIYFGGYRVFPKPAFTLARDL